MLLGTTEIGEREHGDEAPGGAQDYVICGWVLSRAHGSDDREAKKVVSGQKGLDSGGLGQADVLG